MNIKIISGNIEAIADLYPGKTAEAIWQALPLHARANLFGEEVYFSIPVHMELEDGKKVVNAGDLGFWPSGDAFCIFFGETPVSKKGEIRPASAVSVFGRIIGSPAVFKQVKSGDIITVEKFSD